jgi:glyceraldehyde-3-phosphate dehydrogenase (NADP+)
VAGVARAAAARARRREEVVRLMALEGGKPIRFCRAELSRAMVTLRLSAAQARSFGGEVLPIDLEPRGEGRLGLFTRVPRGPLAAISPFNFPLNLVAHKLGPAIAVGTSTVLKPPPQSPLTSHLLARILAEVGLPEDGLSVVHCAPETAQRMVEDPRIAVLSFTGSDRVGWRLKQLAGKKHVLLELGGNAPCIVDEGVDLDAAMEPLLLGSFAQAGQVCIKVQRIYVHHDLYEPFRARFVVGARALACGDPLDERTVVGPLIEPGHVDRILTWVREAVQGGAALLCGGTASGQVVEPTVLTGVDPSARVCSEEVFGPVVVLSPFATFDEAIARCNATRYGLQAGVFTPNLGRAMQAFAELRFGGVLINDVPTFRVDNVPYGGTKDSGLGREGVRFAMEELTEPRLLVLRA